MFLKLAVMVKSMKMCFQHFKSRKAIFLRTVEI